ncbi:MAG: GlxA family transcriptional regulator [Gemmatimonadales bacterium]
MSCLTSIYDVLNCFASLSTIDPGIPPDSPFEVTLVGAGSTPITTASGLKVSEHRSLQSVTRTDIVIVPSLLVRDRAWVPGRYPELVAWLAAMHRKGAILCSACSGVLLLAETGLLDGQDVTIHWAYTRTFQENFPRARLQVARALVASGKNQEFVMSGASASWHDLILYLIARYVGPAAAQAITRFLMLEWHRDGQAPYVMFQEPAGHHDVVVSEAQRWLREHHSVANPVEELVKRSGVAERSFKRRFKQATGWAPIAYVQRLRIEDAKRRLEQTDASIEEISWKVGYEDAAFFRRLFRRVVGLPPGAYRRKFRLPAATKPPAVPPRFGALRA